MKAATRNVIRPNFALVTPDGYVPSAIPGWAGGTIYVLISGAMGAGFSQWLIELEKGARGRAETGEEEWFFYVVSGRGRLNAGPVETGGFGYFPPGSNFVFVSGMKGTQVLLFRKKYVPLPDVTPRPIYLGEEHEAVESPFLGDPHARLKTLLLDRPAHDMAMNIFTYDPGATLPFVETHVMEHGIYFLSGSGIYRLGDEWFPVQAGDTIWIAPYCPQWFIAAGPEPARYLYYKDVNRIPR